MPRGRGDAGVVAVAVVAPDPAWRLLPGYSDGVDVPAMLFQLHEWDIHIVCRGADDAGGAGGAAADDPPQRTIRRTWPATSAIEDR
jgi:hypothetical protein